MGYGLELQNNLGTAVLSSDALGYTFHSSQTHTDAYSTVSGTYYPTGVWEVYRVNTGTSTPPLVFITDLGSIPESSVSLSDTSKMVSVSAITLVSAGVWDVSIRRGHDKISSTTNPIKLLFFIPVETTLTSGYGVAMFNTDGKVAYDSTKNNLMPKVFGVYGGNYSPHSIDRLRIVNYAERLSFYGITRPALNVSGNFIGRETQGVGYGIYCTAYHHTLFTLYSEGVATFYGRVGHNSDSTANPDTCDFGSAPDELGTISTGAGFTYLVIDADDYD